MIGPTNPQIPLMEEDSIDLQIQELLDAILDLFGYDFRNYSKASQKRRVLLFLKTNGLSNVRELIEKIISDRIFFFEFLNDFTISTTELFRDPLLYRALIQHIIPTLQTYPALKVWHAGCSTGEEVYSMSILLHEKGLLPRTTIYATDINRHALEQAKKGIVSSQILKRDSNNYFESGLDNSLTDYWHTQHGYCLLDKALLENVVFSEHNLATDAAFSEMQLIFCRNVLIYFNRDLQNRALELFRDSLCHHGTLCLGTKESIEFSSVAKDFLPACRPQRIFQKKTRMYA